MAFISNYSFLDRLIHKLAFSSRDAQIAISDMESTFFSKEIANLENSEPLFITGLPRAGTTILLDLFDGLDESASHAYRDMPFIMTPLFWNKFSNAFKKDDLPKERAHGDGILVSLDSPEAFEEVLWHLFWNKQYRQNFIEPWDKKPNKEFNDFFCDHMKKIIKLRVGSKPNARYVSKNNLNISRLPYLSNLFPEGKIIVPFREPVQHAGSLLKQHLNFSSIHSEDSFARDYMRALGHYDFGENLKPVNFSNWMQHSRYSNPVMIEFWLEYWIASYEFLLKQEIENAGFFCYEFFCERPEYSLDKLSKFAGVVDKDKFVGQADRIKTPIKHVPEKKLPADLILKANELYEKLKACSINI